MRRVSAAGVGALRVALTRTPAAVGALRVALARSPQCAASSRGVRLGTHTPPRVERWPLPDVDTNAPLRRMGCRVTRLAQFKRMSNPPAATQLRTAVSSAMADLRCT
jgi:hypothetical protein